MSLFDTEPQPVDPRTVPLAERMRPRTLDEVVGQDEVIGPGRPLREMIERDLLQSENAERPLRHLRLARGCDGQAVQPPHLVVP